MREQSRTVLFLLPLFAVVPLFVISASSLSADAQPAADPTSTITGSETLVAEQSAPQCGEASVNLSTSSLVIRDELAVTPMGGGHNECPPLISCTTGCSPNFSACSYTDMGYDECSDGTINGFSCGHGKTVHRRNCNCKADSPGTPCLHVYQDLVCL